MVFGHPDKEQIEPPPQAVREWVVALPVPNDTVAPIPVPNSTLIGRDAEIERLTALLAEPATRLVTLTGPGGIGKTRLALAVAAAMQGRLTDGAVFVDLSAVTNSADVVPTIALALRLRERAGQDQERQVIDFLRSHELLLVLDNLEQILDAAPRIARMAQEATGTTLLLTSRAPLRIGGERVVPVHPLPLADRNATPEALQASDAGRLFVERALARDPSFVIDEQSAPLIAEICVRLDGLPLAIELAAARSRLLSPRQLHDRLEQALALLVRGDRDAPPRHLTMRDAIAWSYDLLGPEEQRLFRQLSVFSGGFTLDAAEWFNEAGPAEGAAKDSTMALLDALLDQSLVVRDVGSDGEPRFRMLETIRAYGLERSTAAETAAAKTRHARYFRSLTQTLRPIVVTESARAPLDRLAAEDANVRSALIWLEDQEDYADFAAMAAALSGYWHAFSRLSEAATWIGRALATPGEIPRSERARLLVAFGILSGFQGDMAAAERANAEALPMSRDAGDPLDLAMALTSYGAARNHQGAYADAAELLEEGRTVAASIVDSRQRAAMTGRALANLSLTARGNGNFALAISLCETALEGYRGFLFDLAETRVFMDLAGIAHARGDLPLMVKHCQTCLDQTGERGDMRVVWIALAGIAGACSAWDQPAAAVLLYAASEAVRERVGLTKSLQSDRSDTENDLARLRGVMGHGQFAATWAEGRTLSLARILELAASVSPTDDAQRNSPPAPRSLLTRREQDVLRLLAAGHSDRDIAASLFIGPRTVSWHVGSILSKLEVSTRSQAAIKAHTDGFL